MGLIIGMDEAGYGPNLGPLVVTVTVWEVPDPVKKADLWSAFDGIVTQDLANVVERLLIADSKQVYTPAAGLSRLERGVLSALSLMDCAPLCWTDLLTRVGAKLMQGEPWFHEAELTLPLESGDLPLELIANWRQRCCDRGIRLVAIRSDVVLTRRFNDRTTLNDSKGLALSELSLELVRSVWPTEPTQILVQADKHGGRNRYHDLLPIVVGDQFIRCLKEGMESSRYKVESAEFRFETQSERYFPVALASMVSKYLRELSMRLFNTFWRQHIPDLKPTAGYPNDARRFRTDIAAAQQRLAIDNADLWRER